jgi:phosphomannomutase/phosphoglucomutase
VKYDVVSRVVRSFEEMRARGEPVGGHPIRDLVTVNGVRVVTDDGTWGLVRASSNKPELVVVVESPASEAVDQVLRRNPEVGPYNQTI